MFFFFFFFFFKQFIIFLFAVIVFISSVLQGKQIDLQFKSNSAAYKAQICSYRFMKQP